MAQTSTHHRDQLGAVEAPPGPRPPGRLGPFARTFTALRTPGYRYLLTGTFFSSMGQWVEQVTLGWLVYNLTGSSVLLGLINGARSIPFLITGPVAGAIIDRTDRRKMLMATQSFLMVATALLAADLLTGAIQVWHVFAFTLATGVAWSLNQPLRQTLVASVVPKSDIANAVSLNAAAFNLTRIIGPSVGGLLIVLISPGGNFLVQSSLYLLVVLTISRMRVPGLGPRRSEGSVLRTMAEGARWVWRNPSMRGLMLMALIPSLIAMPYMSLMPVFAEDVLQVGPSGLGLLLTATGLGAFVGALAVAAGLRTRRREAAQFLALALMGLTLIAFSQSRSLWTALPALVLSGVCQMVYMNTNQGVLQTLVPDHLRGRVSSIYMLTLGMMPLGTFFAGLVTSIIGPSATVSAMGAGCVVVAALAWRLMPPITRDAAVDA